MFNARPQWLAAVALLAAACSSAPSPTPTVQLPSVVSPRPGCQEGTGDCDGRADNACETPLSSSPAHCGACGHACSEGESCALGTCVRAPVLSLSATQGCAIRPPGKLRCWGSVQLDELDVGDLSTPELTLARPVDGAEDAIAVRGSMSGSCAVLRTGQLRCWADGQRYSAPFDLAGRGDAVDVSPRMGGAFALRARGSLSVLGTSIPNDEEGDPITPPDLLRDGVALTTASRFTCALQKGGVVACWGLWRSGSLHEFFEPVPMPGLTDITHLASFGSRACAVRRSGQIACWSDESGAGHGAASGDPAIVAVPGVAVAIEVALGAGHACALLRSGEVTCWGRNTYGQLGDGSRRTSADPVTVQGLKDALHVAAGGDTSCAMRRSGEVVCWGSASRGALGNGITSSALAPVEVAGVSEVTALALGPGYSCALLRDGKVSCWGRGSHGSEGDRLDSGAPWTIPGLDDVTSLVAGKRRICAVRKTGDVLCLRDGIPPWTDPAAAGNAPWRPTPIATLGPVRAISAVGQIVVALRPNGTVDLVQVPAAADPGDAPLVASVRPVPGIKGAIAVASVAGRACALRRDGGLACFRFDVDHTFGANPVAPPAVIESEGPKNVERVFAAGSELFAVRAGGTIFRLVEVSPSPPGRPTIVIKSRFPGPVAPPSPPAVKIPTIVFYPVTELVGAVDLVRAPLPELSARIECVLLGSGQVRCDAGERISAAQLGHDRKNRGAVVPGLSDATAIALASTHACALRKDGRVMCWGQDLDGEVGRGVRAFSATPVQVQGLDR